MDLAACAAVAVALALAPPTPPPPPPTPIHPAPVGMPAMPVLVAPAWGLGNPTWGGAYSPPLSFAPATGCGPWGCR